MAADTSEPDVHADCRATMVQLWKDMLRMHDYVEEMHKSMHKDYIDPGILRRGAQDLLRQSLERVVANHVGGEARLSLTDEFTRAVFKY